MAKSINPHCDGEISFTTLNDLVDKIGVNSVDVNISSSIDSLTDKLQEIQKRLSALESKQDRAPKVACARLRPLLKTLSYEREVQ